MSQVTRCVFVFVFVFVFVIVFFLVTSCPLITLSKCLKGHKSLGSLCSFVKTLVVTDGQVKQGTRSPNELFWTAKKTMTKMNINGQQRHCSFHIHLIMTTYLVQQRESCTIAWRSEIRLEQILANIDKKYCLI